MPNALSEIAAPLLPEVDDGLDPALLEGLQQEAVGDVVPRRLRREPGAGDGHCQVEAGLGLGDVEQLLVQRPVHEEVRPDAEQDRGRRHEGDEGQGQASANPVQAMHRRQRTAL